MVDYNKALGKRITIARNNLDLTMKELGKLLKLHESTVQRYESGEIKRVDIEKVKEFARVLKVSPIYLLGWEESTDF